MNTPTETNPSEGPFVEKVGDRLVIQVPMKLKRRGGRKEIIVPEGLPTPDPRKAAANEPLVVALARAHHWMDLLDTGRYATFAELARALGVDRSYVSRLLRLTLLAPDIVTAILRGEEPCGLSFRRLRSFPVLWTEQRVALGLETG